MTPEERTLWIARVDAEKEVLSRPEFGHGSLFPVLGSALSSARGVLDILAHLPPIPRVASEWFCLEGVCETHGGNWIRTAYHGTNLVRLCFGPTRDASWTKRKPVLWGCFAARAPGGTVDVRAARPEDVFQGICDGLRSYGWELPGEDIPPPFRGDK